MAVFDQAYFTQIIILVAGFCVAAFLTAIWLCCFYICRCCFGAKCCPQCCQNCANCLCGGKPKESYSDNYKRFFFFGSITLALITFIFVVIGFSGNTQVSNGISSFTGNIVSTTNDIYNKTDYAYNQTKKLKGSSSSLANQFLNVRDEVGTIRGASLDIRVQVVKYDGIRRAIMGVGFAIPLFGVLFAAIGLIFGKKGFQYVMVFLVGIGLIFFWLSLAIHVPVNRISSDACDEVTKYLDHPELIGDDTNFLVSCLKNGTFFAPLQGTMQEIQDRMTQLKNDAAAQGFNISDALPQDGATVEDQVTNIAKFCSAQLTQLSNQMEGHTDTPEIQSLKDEIDNANIFLQIAVDLSELARCDYLVGLLRRLKDSFCKETIGGTKLIVAALSALIPLTILACYFVLALFLIRFPAEARAYYELQMEGQPNPSPVGMVVVTTQLVQPQPTGPSAQPSVGSGGETSGTEGETTGTTGVPQGPQMACYSCQALFTIAPGTASGTVVACPNCHSHNRVP